MKTTMRSLFINKATIFNPWGMTNWMSEFWDSSIWSWRPITWRRLLSSRCSPAVQNGRFRTVWARCGRWNRNRLHPSTCIKYFYFVCHAFLWSWVVCLINLFPALFWVIERQAFGAGPEWWSCMCERGWQRPRSPRQALTCRGWSWGSQTHPNPPTSWPQ